MDFLKQQTKKKKTGRSLSCNAAREDCRQKALAAKFTTLERLGN